MKDIQMNKVYDWERQLWSGDHEDKVDSGPMPRSLIKIASRQIAIDNDIEPPRLEWRARLKNRASYHPQDHSIRFPGDVNSWASNVMVVLHEMAHAIVDTHMKRDGVPWGHYEAHGPEFMRTYINLIVEHTDFDERYLLDTCRFMGIRVGYREK